MNLINKAYEGDAEDHAFAIYTSIYPHMDKEKFITFSEFWDQIKPDTSKFDTRPKDVIMNELQEKQSRMLARKG